MSNTFSKYRVLYKKHNEAEVTMSIETSSIEQVYSSICSCAGVKCTTELEFLEIHHVKNNGEVHVYKNVGEPKKVDQLPILFEEKMPGVTCINVGRYEVVPPPCT